MTGPRASGTTQIVLVQGHPDPLPRHFCHALSDAYVSAARQAGHTVDVVNVARLEFPLARSREDLEQRQAPDAIRQVQETLRRSDHVVLIYPIWNGGMPALLKGFFEQTFRTSFVFPDAEPGQRLGFASYFKQRKALAGKTGRVIATMQMPGFVYRWYFHPHLERNAMRLSGIGPIRETLIGLVEAPEDARRRRWLFRMQSFGRTAR
jgi:putative NADPH-quinone reductase